MADNKVTIDAAWFAELYEKANENKSKELFFGGPPQSFYDKIDALTKERDELKAKLEQERMNKCDEATAKRLAAAERCIEDCLYILEDGHEEDHQIIVDAVNHIRAYREKEEK